MNFKKMIAAALSLSILVGKPAGCYEIKQTEVALMSSAENISILPAVVNSEYKQVSVDGSTVTWTRAPFTAVWEQSLETTPRGFSWTTRRRIQRHTGR